MKIAALLPLLLCGEALAVDSPIMLSGPWVPENTHEIDFAALPRVPSEHIVICDVRAKGADPTKLDKKAGGHW